MAEMFGIPFGGPAEISCRLRTLAPYFYPYRAPTQ